VFKRPLLMCTDRDLTKGFLLNLKFMSKTISSGSLEHIVERGSIHGIDWEILNNAYGLQLLRITKYFFC